MTTAIDTNVIIALWDAEDSLHRTARAALDKAFNEGTLVISGAAYAEFSEKTKGELVPEKWADLVVLDRDITAIPPEEILATKVLRTVVGGKTVYEAH